MLARDNRVIRADDFRAAMRRGRRASGQFATVHSLATAHSSVRFGLVVSRAVGNAVVRNLVRRRLRAICREVIPAVSPGHDVIVRANPSAATASWLGLRSDVQSSMRRAGALS